MLGAVLGVGAAVLDSLKNTEQKLSIRGFGMSFPGMSFPGMSFPGMSFRCELLGELTA